MNILHTVESYLPARHGMQEVVTRISKYLVLKGHNVTIATSYNEKRQSDYDNSIPIIEFDISGNYTKGYFGDTNQYINFLKNSNYDIVVNFAAQQWATDLMLPILKDVRGKKVFVPTGFSEISSLAYSDYFSKMKLWMKDYDCNIFLSNDYQDINFARKNSVFKNVIIPNGADENEFTNVIFKDVRELLKIDNSWKIILSVGSHTGYKGHDSLIKIFKKLKTKKIALLVIGNNTSNDSITFRILKNLINLLKIKRSLCFYSCKFEELKGLLLRDKKIFVKKFSRDDTINAYNQSNLFLFPSMIECSPIVLFEAMASKTPFAVTNVGNSKEIISWTNGGVLLPTSFDGKSYSKVEINEAVDLIDNLINDNKLLSHYSIEGNASFSKKFTWEKIGEMYNDLYASLIKNNIKFVK